MSKRIKEDGISLVEIDMEIRFTGDKVELRAHRVSEKVFLQLSKMFEVEKAGALLDTHWVNFLAEITLFKE